MATRPNPQARADALDDPHTPTTALAGIASKATDADAPSAPSPKHRFRLIRISRVAVEDQTTGIVEGSHFDQRDLHNHSLGRLVFSGIKRKNKAGILAGHSQHLVHTISAQDRCYCAAIFAHLYCGAGPGCDGRTGIPLRAIAAGKM